MNTRHSNGEELGLRLVARLEALKAEHAVGERRLMALDAERHQVRDTLLRIGGAIQILEEQLADAAEPAERAATVP